MVVLMQAQSNDPETPTGKRLQLCHCSPFKMANLCALFKLLFCDGVSPFFCVLSLRSHRQLSVPRCSVRIPSAVSDTCCGPDGGNRLSSLQEQVATMNTKYDLGGEASTPTASATATAAGGGGSGTGSVRTHCRPSFKDGDRPLDVTQTVLPTEVLDISAFDSDKELLATIQG